MASERQPIPDPRILGVRKHLLETAGNPDISFQGALLQMVKLLDLNPENDKLGSAAENLIKMVDELEVLGISDLNTDTSLEAGQLSEVTKALTLYADEVEELKAKADRGDVQAKEFVDQILRDIAMRLPPAVIKAARGVNNMWEELQQEDDETRTAFSVDKMRGESSQNYIKRLEIEIIDFVSHQDGNLEKLIAIAKKDHESLEEDDVSKLPPTLNVYRPGVGNLADDLRKAIRSRSGHDKNKNPDLYNPENQKVEDVWKKILDYITDHKYTLKTQVTRLLYDLKFDRDQINQGRIEDAIRNITTSMKHLGFDDREIENYANLIRTYANRILGLADDEMLDFTVDTKYYREARDKIRRAFAEKIPLSSLWENGDGSHFGRMKTEAPLLLLDTIEQLLFDAYSPIYMTGRPDPESKNTDKVAKFVIDNLPTEYNEWIQRLLTTIDGDISAIPTTASADQVKNTRSHYAKLREAITAVSKQIKDLQNVHSVIGIAIDRFAGSSTGSDEDKDKAFVKFLREDMDYNTRQAMVRIYENFDTNRAKSVARVKGERVAAGLRTLTQDQIQYILKNLVIDVINANDGRIPKDFFLELASEINLQSVNAANGKNGNEGSVKLFLTKNKLIHSFISDLQNAYGAIDEADQRRITMHALNYLAMEIATGHLTEIIKQSQEIYGNFKPWELRGAMHLARRGNPVHMMTRDSLMGSFSAGRGGTQFSLEPNVIPIESVVSAISHDYADSPINERAENVIEFIANLAKVAGKHPKATVGLLLKGFGFPVPEGFDGFEDTGVGVMNPSDIKELISHLLQFDAPKLDPKLGDDVKSRFLDDLNSGRSDVVLPWSTQQRELGIALFQHGRQQGNFLKKVKEEVAENLGHNKPEKVTFEQLCDYVQTHHGTAEIFDLLASEARERSIDALLLSLTPSVVAKDLKREGVQAKATNITELQNEYDRLKAGSITADEYLQSIRNILGKKKINALVEIYEIRKGTTKKVLTLKGEDGRKSTFTEFLLKEFQILHTQSITRLDPKELLDTIIMRIPALADGVIEVSLREANSNPPNFVKTKISASTFYLNTSEDDIYEEDLKRQHRRGRHEIFTQLNGYQVDAKMENGKVVENGRFDALKSEIASTMHVYDDVTAKYDEIAAEYEERLAKNPELERLPTPKRAYVLKIISDVAREARFGSETIKPYLVKDKTTGRWKLEANPPIIATTVEMTPVEFLRISMMNTARTALFGGGEIVGSSFFEKVYITQVNPDDERRRQLLLGRFSTTITRGWGNTNSPIPFGSVDVVKRLKESSTETYIKAGNQYENLAKVNDIFAKAKKNISEGVASRDQKKFYESVIKSHDEMNEILLSYVSDAEKDKWHTDLFKVTCRLVGESMQGRGLWGMFATFAHPEELNIPASKDPIDPKGAFSLDMKGMHGYARRLMQKKFISDRAYEDIRNSLRVTSPEMWFGTFIPLYGTAALAYFVLWTINEAYKDAQEDAGVNLGGGKGGGKGK